MNWFLLLTFVALMGIVKIELIMKPRFDWDEENKKLYLWYNIRNKYFEDIREYITII